MREFCWQPDDASPPVEWDLRLAGWRLRAELLPARGNAAPLVLRDARAESAGLRRALVSAAPRPGLLVLLGIEQAGERAELLALGCGEALPASVALSELAARAERLAATAALLPTQLSAGLVVLDLFHRDARVGRHWLALHPREFALFWRLAEAPGQRVTRRELLRDVWRLSFEPETNSVEVHVSRLRSKLAVHGLYGMIATDPLGGYRLSRSACAAGSLQPACNHDA